MRELNMIFQTCWAVSSRFSDCMHVIMIGPRYEAVLTTSGGPLGFKRLMTRFLSQLDMLPDVIIAKIVSTVRGMIHDFRSRIEELNDNQWWAELLRLRNS